MPRGRLYVEGANDLHFLRNLLQKHGIDARSQDKAGPEHVEVREAGGIEKMSSLISAEVRAAAYPIGFVADVDPHIGLAERWQMLTQPMRNVIDDVPEVIDKSGWLHDDPRVGVWLMPDNEANGAIEDFIRQIKLAGSEALWGYAVESTARSRSFGSTFRDVDCRKAEVHTFLGWQDPPGLRYGEAVSRGCFDHEADLAKRFVSWFKRLYSI